jgi:hypothetical protein
MPTSFMPRSWRIKADLFFMIAFLIFDKSWKASLLPLVDQLHLRGLWRKLNLDKTLFTYIRWLEFHGGNSRDERMTQKIRLVYGARGMLQRVLSIRDDFGKGIKYCTVIYNKVYRLS